MTYNIGDIVLVKGVPGEMIAGCSDLLYIYRVRDLLGGIPDERIPDSGVIESCLTFKAKVIEIKNKPKDHGIIYKLKVHGNYFFNLYNGAEGCLHEDDIKGFNGNDILCSRCEAYCQQKCFTLEPFRHPNRG